MMALDQSGPPNGGSAKTNLSKPMRISHFFIDRPIFASVLAIVIIILGSVTFFRLPVAQYSKRAADVNIGHYTCASVRQQWPH